MTTDSLCAGQRFAAPAMWRHPRRLAAYFLRVRAAMQARARARRMLNNADPRLFADLGISPAQAAFEAARFSAGGSG